jgi:hypothetical protein
VVFLAGALTFVVVAALRLSPRFVAEWRVHRRDVNSAAHRTLIVGAGRMGERLVRELRAALAEVRTLREILPICSYCKKIRDDENYWQNVESYISQHTNTRFSHGICPSCFEQMVAPQFEASDEG